MSNEQIGVSHATKRNSRFQSDKDIFLTLWERYQAIIDEDPDIAEVFEAYGDEFKTRYPQYKTFKAMMKDMVGLGDEGRTVAPDTLVINATIQREPDAQWLCELFGKFDPFFVNPIRTYKDNVDGEEQLIVWDGQHTALLLLIVARYGFGLTIEDAQKFKMPTAIYPGKDVVKIRDRFIGFNDGSMSKELDKIDHYDQYVYAVRHNGSKNPWHERMEAIQTGLEENDMFFTHEKFGDNQMAGAISRPSEIFPKRIDKFSVSTLCNVFKYHALSNPDLSVEPLEIDNMSHIFRACEEQGIEVNEDYIQQFVDVLDKVTNNTWKHRQQSKNSKHKKVSDAYTSWRARQGNADTISQRCNQTLVAPTWLCQAVVLAGFKYAVPKFGGNMNYRFTEEELS